MKVDYDYPEISLCRQVADELWRIHAPDGVSVSLPSYLVDRIGYRVSRCHLLGGVVGRELLEDCAPFQYAAADYEENLASWLHGHEEAGAFPPDVRGLFPSSPFIDEMLALWIEHLHSAGIEVGTEFDGAAFDSWSDCYAHSVYFPGPPAIPGPGFLDWLSTSQVATLRARYGVDRAWEFAVGLSIIHEGSHFLQRGEPLLSEFVWAALWVEFCERYGFVEFQRNDETGKWCNLEEPYLRPLDLNSAELRSLWSDTARGVVTVFGEDRSWYGLLCHLAWLTDNGQIDYFGYLSRVRSVFESRNDWERAVESALVDE